MCAFAQCLLVLCTNIILVSAIASHLPNRIAKQCRERWCHHLCPGINKDPWKLKAIRNNQWTTMKSPPLEMFHWNRVVVDEFTYLKLRSRAAVHMGLVSKYRWSLSGTPPISHFADVKSIAASIGVHLGVHESTVDNKAKATTTALEKLQHFQHVRSKGWHAKR